MLAEPAGEGRRRELLRHLLRDARAHRGPASSRTRASPPSTTSPRRPCAATGSSRSEAAVARLPAACLRLQRRVADVRRREHGALRPGERALLLLSGGADSMALLSLRARRRPPPGPRPGARGAARGLRPARRRLRPRPPDRRARLRGGRRAAARGAPARPALRPGLPGARPRRSGTGAPASSPPSTATTSLVTAHNRDDQAETVLYRLAKYASPRGLAGMRPRDGDLARPLLGLGRGGDQGVLPRRRHRVRRGRDQRGAAVRAQRPAPRGAAAARGAEPARRRDARGGGGAGGGRGGGAGRRRRRGAAARAAAAARPGDLAAVDLAALAAEPPALRALVLHDLLREAMGGDALVERRLVEALLRLARARRRRRPRRASAAASRRSAARGVLRIRAVAAGARLRAGRGGRRGPRGAPARPAWPSRFCGRRLARCACCPARPSTARPRWPARPSPASTAPPRRVTLRHPRRGERFAPLGLGGETTRRPLPRRGARPGRAAPARAACSTSTARAAWVGRRRARQGCAGLPGGPE